MKPCLWILVFITILASCATKRAPLQQRCHTWAKHSVLHRCDSFLPYRFGSFCSTRACDGTRIAKTARNILTTQHASTQDDRFRRDCSGFVMAVLAKSGVQIRNILPKRYRGEGGVSLLYRLAFASGRLHQHKVPAIGDLVFFDNTHDRNRNGRLDDPLTHIGIVERVDPDGTVTFIHHVRRGILRYRLNLFKPTRRRDASNKKVLNHHLRMGDGKQRLTGELFHAFASIS